MEHGKRQAPKRSDIYYSQTTYRPPCASAASLRKSRSARRHLAVAGLSVLLLVGITVAIRHSKAAPVEPAISISKVLSLVGDTVRQTLPIPEDADQGAVARANVDSAEGSVKKAIAAYSNLEISVSVKDLLGGQSFDINGNTPYTAASTTKMLAACLFLKKVDDGTMQLNGQLGNYTAQRQLQQMVNQSNNDSWAYFNDTLSFASEEDYAKSIGNTSYKSAGNIWSANAMALLLQKLYNGQLLSQKNTSLLLSYMTDTVEEGYIPQGLPSGATVYHKTGVLEDNVHDGAIVDDGKHKYVLVIFSNGNGAYQYEQRQEAFHAITKAVADSFQ